MRDRLGVRLTGRLALLVASMRAAGARIGVGDLRRARRALAAVDPTDHAQAYFALRPMLCSRHDDFLAFDAAFAEWFGIGAPPAPAEWRDEIEAAPAARSGTEPPRGKDFADYTDADRAVARQVMRRLAAPAPRRPSRRVKASPRRGTRPPAGRPDLRRALRASLRHDGEPLQRHWREPSERPRPSVFVCDASGAMEPYARMLLQFAQACVAAHRHAEAFVVVGSRLTRVAVEPHDLDPALKLGAAAAGDGGDGTHIGAALGQLNREHGARVERGAIVVVLSGGWGRGDPLQLEREVERLGRRAHRLVWLDPLEADPGRPPYAHGEQAALRHVDRFMAGNSLQSLERLAFLMDGGFE